MKDWTGNSKTAFVTLGASNHSAGERQAHDFYATSPKAVSQLLDAEVFSRDILEPCCGAGHIAKVLAARGYNVKAHDLYDYGYGESGVDFLAYNTPFNGDVITNPPYKYATEFVIHALELIPLPLSRGYVPAPAISRRRNPIQKTILARRTGARLRFVKEVALRHEW